VERRSVADHRCLARRPVLNDPIQLIGPGSPFGNNERPFPRAGPIDAMGRAMRNGRFVAAFYRWSAAMPSQTT
jgi:hypothetical protein